MVIGLVSRQLVTATLFALSQLPKEPPGILGLVSKKTVHKCLWHDTLRTTSRVHQARPSPVRNAEHHGPISSQVHNLVSAPVLAGGGDSGTPPQRPQPPHHPTISGTDRALAGQFGGGGAQGGRGGAINQCQRACATQCEDLLHMSQAIYDTDSKTSGHHVTTDPLLSYHEHSSSRGGVVSKPSRWHGTRQVGLMAL
jgi:hypothetical protein